MDTIVPDDFTVDIGAAQAKKKKKKTNKKKKAADVDEGLFRYRLADIPQLNYTMVGNRILLKQGPPPAGAGVDPDQQPDQVVCCTIDGESVTRFLTENQWVYLSEVRPDLRYSPEMRPKPSARSDLLQDNKRPANRETVKNEYQTISTINVFRKILWRPGNTLRDASPTEGLYIDGRLVELVTSLKPEQDVPPSSLSGPAPKLLEKAQLKQEVRARTSLTHQSARAKIIHRSSQTQCHLCRS